MSAAQVSRGRSNYGDLPDSEFVGKYGGAYKRSFPVNTRGRAIAALARAHFAPNPDGIRRAVYRVAKRKGWINPRTGKISRK